MVFTYRVVLETDKETREIVAFLPTLHYTADFGGTVEEALTRLQELATGFIETLQAAGEAIPPSDPVSGRGLYLSVEVEAATAA